MEETGGSRRVARGLYKRAEPTRSVGSNGSASHRFVSHESERLTIRRKKKRTERNGTERVEPRDSLGLRLIAAGTWTLARALACGAGWRERGGDGAWGAGSPDRWVGVDRRPTGGHTRVACCVQRLREPWWCRRWAGFGAKEKPAAGWCSRETVCRDVVCGCCTRREASPQVQYYSLHWCHKVFTDCMRG